MTTQIQNLMAALEHLREVPGLTLVKLQIKHAVSEAMP